MRIQMIGTGSAFSKKFYNNNALVYTDQYTLLIDCGITAPLALHELGRPMQDIDGVIVTHQHGDHIGGLEELAFQFRYNFKQKITLFIAETLVDSLWEHSLKGGLSDGEADCDLHTYFHVVPLKEGETKRVSDDLTIEIMRTEHIPNKFSYAIILNDKLFYSADTRFNRAMLEHVFYERGIRHILHECQLEGYGAVHTTLEELLTLPENIQQHIQLMHYDDQMGDFIGKTGKMTFLEQHRMYNY